MAQGFTGGTSITSLTLKDSNFTLQDDGDTSKQAQFQLSGITTGTTRTYTLPDASIILVGTTNSQTLQNKTIDNSNTVTIKDTLFTVQDNADTTKQAQFEVSGITTGTTRTYTFPDASITLVGTTNNQTLQNKTLDNTNIVTLKDTLFTLQDDGDTTKQAQFQLSSITTGTTRTYTFPDASITFVGTTNSQTLQNKTIDNTNTVTLKDTLFTLQDDGDTSKQAVFQLSGITTATTRTLTVPDANITLVGTTNSQTLQNKTLDNTNTISLKDTLFTLQDDGDTTKQAQFQLSSISTATTRTYTFPNVTGDIAVLTANGISVRTGSATFTSRSLTAPAAGITISNNDGVSGNPTFALANDLSAVEGLSTTGLATRTATDTWTTRSLTAPAAGITISNNDGVSGNPTFALANDLSALEGLTGTGFAVRTATDTWTNRSLTAGAGISITNPDGVSGNPTITASITQGKMVALSMGTFSI